MGAETNEVFGRERELVTLGANLRNPDMQGVMLIGPPGSGKTQIVEAYAVKRRDSVRTLNVDIAMMKSGGSDTTFEVNFKNLMNEITAISKDDTREDKRKVMIFIDEVHVLGMPDYIIGLEVLKPALSRGLVSMIGATTDEEYIEWIQPNQALTERFERLDMIPPNDDVVKKIVISRWKKGIPGVPVDEELIDELIWYTNKYMPSSAQPRKAIRVLSSMIGWHLETGIPFDHKLLISRIRSMTGANPEWNVDVDLLADRIKASVKGQDRAINLLRDSLSVAVANLNDESRPMGVFLYTGTTGTGKTMTAKMLSEGLFGHQDAMIRFDMSEYQTRESVDLFRERLSDRITKTPFAVVLFDEIEKAYSGVVDLLLQITDDGRLTDRYGRQVSFLNAYIIITTNVGHEVFQEAIENGLSVEAVKKTLEQTVGQDFRPELLGRIDEIIPFNTLDYSVRREISRNALKKLVLRLRDRGIYLRTKDAVADYLALEGVSNDSTAGGGRDLNRRMKGTLLVLLADTITQIPNVVEILVDVYGDMAIRDKRRLVGTSELVIREYIVKLPTGDYSRVYGNKKEGTHAFSDMVQQEIIPKERYRVR